MTNKEKYAKEILDIACKGGSLAMTMEGELTTCYKIDCDACKFGSDECDKVIQKWANSEYIEKPKISKKDKEFLDYLSDKYKWVARDEDGSLFVYHEKPEKFENNYWKSEFGCSCSLYDDFKVNFPMVKWEDETPWFIEDLKKLEIEYEKAN